MIVDTLFHFLSKGVTPVLAVIIFTWLVSDRYLEGHKTLPTWVFGSILFILVMYLLVLLGLSGKNENAPEAEKTQTEEVSP